MLSVGAVDPDGSLASFSDQRSHVAVTAPGVNITSTAPGGYSVNSLSGTSFATAFVSGVAALVRSRYPSLSGPEVVSRIKETADGSTGPGTGDGLVNPLQAVTAILAAAAAQSPSPTPRPQARIGGSGRATRRGRPADGAGGCRGRARPWLPSLRSAPW